LRDEAASGCIASFSRHCPQKALEPRPRAGFLSLAAPLTGLRRDFCVLAYWFLFGFFAVGALLAHVDRTQVRAIAASGATYSERMPFQYLFIFGALATILVIGLRYRVGADWFNYIGIYDGVQRFSLRSALALGDPGYQLVNWVAAHFGLKIWVVNMVAAGFFSWGLYRLCSVQPSPWLAFAVAVPYLVIVVAMGYTRQSMALGVLMAGLAKQTRGASIYNLAIYVALAATFHKTAVIVFPIIAISSRGSRSLNLLILLFASFGLYSLFLGNAMDSLVSNYIDREYDSQGAGIRVAMNLVPAVLLWTFRRKLGFDLPEYRIWRNFALVALAFTVLLFVLPSSTAVDRMSLYIMPLQIAVLARVALLGESRIPGTSAVLIYLFMVQFVWLNFAGHAQYWVPYQLYPF
jgi:EpsG-like putative glucosyltransferase